MPPPTTDREEEPDTTRWRGQQAESAPTPPPPQQRVSTTTQPLGEAMTFAKTSRVLEAPPDESARDAQPARAHSQMQESSGTRDWPREAPTSAPPHSSIPLQPPDAPAPEAYAPRATPPPQQVDMSSPLPPPTAPVRRQFLSDPDDTYESMPPTRGRQASFSDAPQSVGKRRGVGGFIVATVVVLCLLMIGAVWAQKNLGATLGLTKPAPTATSDPRVTAFLDTGEKALADGNHDLAKESFDKASALAEKDPRVLLDVARLAAVRADAAWLKSRLLPSDATDEHRVTRDLLAELSAAALKAADAAIAVSPDDPAALRAKIDALRISGEREQARSLVGKITQGSAQAESAYVLAALDLAEVEPLWLPLIDRLRVASAVETGPGRARTALVYALARSGDVASARAEIERLRTLARPHPLLPLLMQFTDRAKPTVKLDAGPPQDAAVVEDAKAPHVGVGPAGLPRDSRILVSRGDRARRSGDFEKARMHYSAALDLNPNDSEALYGLAAISHAQHDLNGAKASYKRVLSINASYTPALVGLGDAEWESGDRAAAMKTYKQIVDNFPDGSYPPRVKQRLESASSGSGSGSGSGGTGTSGGSSGSSSGEQGGN